MKRLIPLAIASSLWGCVSVPQNVQLPAGQALLVAEASTDGVNHGAILAAPYLHGASATQVKGCVDGTNNAVSAAKTLYSTGDVVGTITNLNTAFSNIAVCTKATNAVIPGASK